MTLGAFVIELPSRMMFNIVGWLVGCCVYDDDDPDHDDENTYTSSTQPQRFSWCGDEDPSFICVQ
jgi:hypothetical protein